MSGYKKSLAVYIYLFLFVTLCFSREKDVFQWLSNIGTVSYYKSDDTLSLSVRDTVDPEGTEMHQKDWNPDFLDSITDLSFSDVDFNSKDLSLMSKFTGLKTLWFFDCNITTAHFQSIGSLDSLTSLRLHKTGIDDRGLEFLKYFKNLETLVLRHNNLSGTGFKHFETLQKLKSITINSRGEVNPYLHHLKKLPALEEVSLYGEITPEGWSALKNISTLKHIGCNGPTVTDDVLKVFSEFLNWKTLSIWHSDYVSYSLKSERHINLRPCKVTVKSLKYLSGLGLKELTLPREFSDTDIDYLKEISDIDKLEILELSDKNTKECLEKLFFLKNLKKLKINNKIRKKDLIFIHRAIPTLKFSRSFNMD